jgi:hypothetical protein
VQTAPSLVRASQGKSIVRYVDRAALLATLSAPRERAERPIDLLSIVPALGGVILFAVTEFLGTGSQVPLLLVIDAI